MPINVTANDPLTAGYKAIVAILKANAAFLEATARFNDWSDSALEKPLQNLNAADSPEVSLVQGAFVLKPFGSNSKVASFTKTYNLVGVGDTLQVADVNAIQYATAAALYHNSPEDATWAGDPFVGSFAITSGADNTGGIRLPGAGDVVRGTDRLSCIVAITLDMHVPRTSLPT